MAKYEVPYVRREVLFTRYSITVEAESAEEARIKVLNYDTTDEEEATIVEEARIKRLGIDDSDLESVGEARKLEEKGDE